jgi:hypothetical protein
VLARQASYGLSHTSSPFCSDYFGNRVSLFAQTGLDCDVMILAIARMTGVHHHTFLSIEVGSHKLFCLDWSGTMILPISAS